MVRRVGNHAAHLLSMFDHRLLAVPQTRHGPEGAPLHLAPTNPTWIYVASPRRVRRKVGEGIIVVQGVPAGKCTNYLGVRSQSLADALLACGSTVRADRRLRAAEEGLRQGYLDNEEFARVNKEIRHGQASA